MHFDDLIGRPYRLHGADEQGMDCSTVAETVLRRLGYDPPPLGPFRIPGSAGAQGEIRDYLRDHSYEWLGRALSDARKEGDLVLVEPARGLGRGLFALADARTGTFLTADRQHGVVAVTRAALYRLPQRVLGVYRCPRESPA